MAGPTDVDYAYVEARVGRAVRIERRSGLEDVSGRLVGVDDLGRVVVEEIGRGHTRFAVEMDNVAALWVAG